MVRLPHAALSRVHRFLLEIHAAGDVDSLRRLIPQGLSRLISTDRASFNEGEFGPNRKAVLPAPLPQWWSRLAEVYVRYMTDHPIWRENTTVPLNRTISFHDRPHFSTLSRSALYHEYFLPLGTRHQLSSMIFNRGTARIGVAVNRSSRGFSAAERATLDLVSPHLGLAWENALALAAARKTTPAQAFDTTKSHAVVAVHSKRGTVRSLSSDAAPFFRKHFDNALSPGGRLPDRVHRWFETQLARVATENEFLADPPQTLEIQSRSGHLTVRLAQHLPEEMIVVLEDATSESNMTRRDLTPREAEILHWLREGKRNGEIGAILGISHRTVGKHVEHILEKLGAETRTAAARVAMQLGSLGNA